MASHPMGAAGFHLEILPLFMLSGAFEADPSTDTVEHSLDSSYTMGCSSAVETLDTCG